ncbi:hypothetical protein JB92DRAFT_3003916 [Gautieria morchelliformis]|nr:hypothetical protein JB92DRAFT_3003916 [Gautieria morchelliformis]
MAIFAFVFIFLALVFVYNVISTIVRKYLRGTLTGMDEIPALGLLRGKDLKISGTAVVCGGSIAGLLSARVCADHFETVVMVEPEESVTRPDDHHHDEKSSSVAQKRSRVPQYNSYHGYQAFMTLAVRKWFPNFDHEVVKAGARVVSADTKFHVAGVPIEAPWHQYTANNFPTITTLTRAGLETRLRRLVLATCPNVKYVPGAVISLVRSESSGDAIDSVRVRSRDGEESNIPATLVIDCTGPARGGFKWLQNPSFTSTSGTEQQVSPLPLEALKHTYDPKMAYTTCAFDVPPALMSPIKALGFPEDFATAGLLYVSAADPSTDSRNVIIGMKGESSVQFACGGWDVRERMTSIADIKKFLSEMVVLRPVPDWIFRRLELFEQEKVPATYVYARCPPSVYIQYHLAKNIPSNFIAIGDSVLTLNPVRGQGCTKACVEAVTLNSLPIKCAATPTGNTKGTGNLLPKDFSRNFFHLQAKRTGALWSVATYKSEDYAWKTTTPAKGDSLESGAWKRAYGKALLQLAIKDRDVSAVFWHAGNWLTPSTELFSPIIILKLAWMQVSGCFGL